MLMWNMTTYKCKLKINRLERETYFSRTKNHSLLLNRRLTPEKRFCSAQKMSVELVETNYFFDAFSRALSN